MDNLIHYKVLDEITYLFPKFQQLHRWSLGMDMQFYPTLYLTSDYLSK